MTPIKDQLRSARIAANLSQGQLAKILGVSRPNVSNWESGKYDNPSTKLIEQWVQATGGKVVIEK